MWMNFDSPNFPSFCSLSAIISFQTCSNKFILYVLSFHKCIKIKYKTVNIYGVFLWLVQSSSRWNAIHSHLLSVRVGEFCHPARSRLSIQYENSLLLLILHLHPLHWIFVLFLQFGPIMHKCGSTYVIITVCFVVIPNILFYCWAMEH